MQPDHSTDFLIIGAGFAGLVAAERLASAGWKCTVVDRRTHLAGNAADRPDRAGVLYHQYGPHYFRTNSRRIFQYLSRFTEWHEVDYTIKSFTRNRYWSFPVNLNTFEELIGEPSTEAQFEQWLEKTRVPYPKPKNSEDLILSRTGPEFYHLFFKDYTQKQWARHPRDLDASVCGRVPIRTNRDNRYLTEQFQALPKHGYTAMFEKMLALNSNINVLLGVDFSEARTRWKHRHLIYTGAVDEYFDYRFGPLPYRSLRFEHQSFTPEELVARQDISGKPGFWQPAMQVNYPDLMVPYTRIVEIKHATGQQHSCTNITREFPKEWAVGGEAYYPIPAPDTKKAYLQYAKLAQRESNTSFIGRLATYRYYNMDQVTGMAIAEADKLISCYGTPARL